MKKSLNVCGPLMVFGAGVLAPLLATSPVFSPCRLTSGTYVDSIATAFMAVGVEGCFRAGGYLGAVDL
jgi:hypothetical protein